MKLEPRNTRLILYMLGMLLFILVFAYGPGIVYAVTKNKVLEFLVPALSYVVYVAIVVISIIMRGDNK